MLFWSYNACLHAPLDGYVDTFGSKDWDTERVWTYVEGMTKELQQAHDSAMSISARAGDSWAIQRFFVKELRRDKEYWKSLYKINPLLFHRSMTDAGISLRLTDREVVMLALNAYDLEKAMLDDLDLGDYLIWHDIDHSPLSDIVLSLKERPIPDEELKRLWVEQETVK